MLGGGDAPEHSAEIAARPATHNAGTRLYETGMTRTQIAERLGVSLGTVANIVGGTLKRD